MASSGGKPPGSPITSPTSLLPTKGGAAGGGGGGSSSPVVKFEEEELGCTERCRSKEHGKRIWKVALGGNDIEVVCLWAKTCLNYSQVKDEFGRTALHAAATTGNLKAVEWLLKTMPCNINGKDFISGYTPLHRSIYFGHFHIARALIKHGADVNVRDNEGLTAFELCQLDRPIPFKQNQGDMTDLTVWGSNANYNLGLGHQQPRVFPDSAPDFRRSEMSLAKVVLNTYHTAFLGQNGKVYVCGYGMSGRLGTGEEGTVLTPTQVMLRNNGPCKDIAVGQNHTIFLTDNKVWTVGSNEHGQLGHSGGLQLQKLCTPRTVDSLTKYNMKGVIAGNLHSIFWSPEVVLMCGQNSGQFGRGFEEVVDVMSPAKVKLPLENVGNGSVTSVGGNEHCTAVCIDKHHVFLLRRHQYARIDSKNTTSQEILKMEVTGDKNNVILFLLTSSGRVLVYRDSYNKAANESKGFFTRLVFSCSRLLDLKDFSVSLSSLIVITSTGEAYKASWNSTNPPSIVGKMEEKYGQVAGTDFQVAVKARNKRKEDEVPSMCLELMKVKRVPNVHTGLYVSSDPKGNNFAILQRHQMMDVTDIPEVIAESMKEDIAELYSSAREDDQICDVVFQVGSFNEYPAHMFILASASPQLSQLLKNLKTNASKNGGGGPLRIKVTNKLFSVEPSKCASLEDPKIFKSLLDMIYTRKCGYMTVDWMTKLYSSCPSPADQNQKKKGGADKGAVYEEKLKELSKFRYLLRALMLDSEEIILHRFYNDVEGQWDSVVVKNACPPTVNLKEYWSSLPDMKFERCGGGGEDSEEGENDGFADVILESSDKKRFPVHMCVLIARLEYYKSLFSSNWAFNPAANGRKKTDDIILTFSSKAVEILLDCIYSNEAPSLKDVEFEVICETLACADFTMNDRLLQMSEAEMTKNITLKNAGDVATFAWKHNAVQLKSTCYDFISLNLTSMLENKLLDNLATEILLEFSGYYKDSQRSKLLLDRDLNKPSNVPDPEEYELAVQQTAEELKDNLKEIEDADSTGWIKKPQAKSARCRVRLRSRTLSETDSLVENEEMEGDAPDITITTTHSPAPSGNAPFMIVTPKGKVKRAGSIKEATPPPTTATPNGTSVPVPERKYVVPLPMNKDIGGLGDTSIFTKAASFKKDEDFPTLVAGPAKRTASDPTVGLGSKPPPAPSKSSSNQPMPFSKSASGNVWNRKATSGSSEAAPSLVVATASKSKSQPSLTLKTVSPTHKPPAPAPVSSSPVPVVASSKKKTKWRTIRNEVDILKKPTTEHDGQPSGPPPARFTSDGRDINNPWKTTETPDKNPTQVVFRTIVEDEVEKKRNFEKATTKALPLMQIEDEAMQFLTQKYTSDDTLDYIELLTVERIVTQNFSTPVWVQQHPGAVTGMSTSTASYPHFKG